MEKQISYIYDITKANNLNVLFYASFVDRSSFRNWSNYFLKLNSGDIRHLFRQILHAKRMFYKVICSSGCSVFLYFKRDFERFLLNTMWFDDYRIIYKCKHTDILRGKWYFNYFVCLKEWCKGIDAWEWVQLPIVHCN